MDPTQALQITLEPHAVTLHYPGAEGVEFEDAVLTIRNGGDTPVSGVGLHLEVTEEGKPAAVNADIPLTEVKGPETLEPGASFSTSLFRLLQKHHKGFASRVNMFGFKASLEWQFQVSAHLLADGQTGSRPAAESWQVHWTMDPKTPGRVLLRVA